MMVDMDPDTGMVDGDVLAGRPELTWMDRCQHCDGPASVVVVFDVDVDKVELLLCAEHAAQASSLIVAMGGRVVHDDAA